MSAVGGVPEVGSQSGNSVAGVVSPDSSTLRTSFACWPRDGGLQPVMHTPQMVGFALTGLLTPGEPPTGTIGLGEWLTNYAGGLGREHVPEIGRNYRR